MNTTKFLPRESDTWRWRLAEVADIPKMVSMAIAQYQKELEGLLVASPRAYEYSLRQALNEQQYQLSREQIMVAHDRTSQQLVAYAWCRRGQYTPYSQEEMAEAAIAHVDLSLPTRTRIRILAQMLQQWILWAHINGIPVLVSSSIRQEQTAFMRLHDAFGFRRVGLIAIKRITRDLS